MRGPCVSQIGGGRGEADQAAAPRQGAHASPPLGARGTGRGGLELICFSSCFKRFRESRNEGYPESYPRNVSKGPSR
jgi:hypothetical protein